MQTMKFLPYRTASSPYSFNVTANGILHKNILCLESFSAYIERHEEKEKIDRNSILKVFKENSNLMLYEFLREFVRNYFLITGSVKIDSNKISSFDVEVQNEFLYNSRELKFFPLYRNSITGRLFSSYQTWENVNGKHPLTLITNEKLTSVDVRSFVLTTYLYFLQCYGEDVKHLLNLIYSEKNIYTYFFITVICPDIFIKVQKGATLLSIFKNKTDILEQLRNLTDVPKSELSEEYINKILKFIGKTVLLSFIYQGHSNIFNELCTITFENKKVLECRILNSEFLLGKWNRYLFELGKQLDTGVTLKKFFNFYIPPSKEYLKQETRLAAYIIENMSNYSLFSSLTKLILRDIPIKGYFFDEVLIPSELFELETIKSCFFDNNLISLKIKVDK